MTSDLVRTPLGRRLADVDLGSAIIGAGLLCFLATVFFNGLMPKVMIMRFAAILLVDSVAMLRLLRKRDRIKLRPAGFMLVVFLLYVVVNQSSSLISGADSYWLYLFSLCFIAAFLVAADSSDWLRFITKTVAIFAAVHAVATIAFFVFPDLYVGWFKPHFYPLIRTAVDYRSGLCNHYSSNGMYLAWGLITSFYLWQSAVRPKNRKWKGAAIVIIVALLLTTKRAHLVFGIVCCVIVYLLLNVGKTTSATTIKLAAFLAVALTVFYAMSLFVPEIAEVVDRLSGAELDEGRADYWHICLNLFQSSPLVGHGWESFTKALYQSGISDLARLYLAGNLYQNAHNVYFQLLAEEGLVGLCLFAVAAVASLVHSIKATISDCRSSIGSLCALSAGIQAFFLLYCITGNPLYDIYEYSVYLLLGLAPFIAWTLPSVKTSNR